jgi:hypothetical protein
LFRAARERHGISVLFAIAWAGAALPDALRLIEKAVHKGKFPVVRFVKDPSGVAALYRGKQEGKDLIYMGKVETPAGLAQFPARSGSSSTR